MKKAITLCIALLLLAGCALVVPGPENRLTLPDPENDDLAADRQVLLTPPLRISFDDFPRAIPVPGVTPERAALFNSGIKGDFIAGYTQPDMTDTLNGYVTDNASFYTQVLYTALEDLADSLKALQKYQAVNALTLFIYESYQDFFGLGFYRWGGDITDRDQPQTAASHSTSTKRFGMDCSGFGASPFEAAVLLGILDSTQQESAFSWFGFRHICRNDPLISDGGGRGGTTNNFRMEVSDMAKVGELITTIPAGTTPDDQQMDLMQAGDVVIKSGHMGILVEINNVLYFLESGGSTVNEDGLYTPYLAKAALADFAQSRTTTIRRCLPVKETTSGIAH